MTEGDEYVGKLIASKYQVEALIGEGGMGKVYRAQQIALDKPVVLKVLRQSLLSDERTVARFQREAKAASRLNHPNSISILDFGQAEDGALYIAMEYVSGRDLHQILSREWPLSEHRVIRIIGQVLSALQEAHSAGVIHRDLKPENIMVEPRRGGEVDFVKVLDFGIAKIQDSTGDEGPALTRAGFVCGTPEYMSPEQARGAPLDARSDLYAVGVILYQLTTGLLPFESDSAVGFATKHLTEMPPPPSQRRPEAKISAPMERLILEALSKNPDDRPQTAEAFKAELFRVGREARRVSGVSSRPHRSSSPVLARIPAKSAPEGMAPGTDASPWSKADTTVKQEAVLPMGEPSFGSAATKVATRVELDAPAIDAPPSMLPFKILTVALVAAVVILGGYYFYTASSSVPDKPYVPPANAPIQLGGVGNGASADPPYAKHVVPAEWDTRKADTSAKAATLAYERGHLGMAISDLLDAYSAAQRPIYALKLGVLYRLRLGGGGQLARNWWHRYLHDEPSSPARSTIVSIYPELKGVGLTP